MDPSNNAKKPTSLQQESSYNLWQDSQYFEFSNFNIHTSLAGGSNWPSVNYITTGFDIKRDERNRRIVLREQLTRDPDCFQFSYLYNTEEGAFSIQCESTTPDSSWTAYNFQKSGENVHVDSEQGEESSNKGRALKRNKIEKKLDQAMASPVKMCKAEKMMHKMGWAGGGLGKDGYGITAPILPNATYASSTLGLGHVPQPPIPQGPNLKPTNEKEIFTTNVLLTILDFLKNDSELELMFDETLFKDERKQIHMIMGMIARCPLYNVDSVQQGDVLAEIEKCNEFLLNAESEGRSPHRSLCLYKEAPPNMYLVTPEDIKPEEEVETVKPSDKTPTTNTVNTTTNTEPLKTDKKQTKQVDKIEKATKTAKPDDTGEKNKTNEPEIDEQIFDLDIDESNPFLLSITRTLRDYKKQKQKRQESVVSKEIAEEITEKPQANDQVKVEKKEIKPIFNIRDAIIGYFKEFCLDDKYLQFRFVGPFTANDFSIIMNFFKDIQMGIEGTKGFNEIFAGSNMQECVRGVELEIKEDRNGHRAIYKKMLEKR